MPKALRGYKNEVHLSPLDWLRQHGLSVLQPAEAGFVSVEAVSNRPPLSIGCAPYRPLDVDGGPIGNERKQPLKNAAKESRLAVSALACNASRNPF
jgi:hypothetical protein